MSEKSNTPTNRLFVGGLPYRFTEGELLSLFAPHGRITSLKIMHTPWGKSRGIGFVEFDNLDSAISAKKSLHNHHVDAERTIIVDYAQPDPLTTAEGMSRRAEAQARKEQRYARFPKHQKGTKPAGQSTSKSKPKFGTVRQSTFDSRSHHSRVGAKFSNRRRSK